MRIDWALLCKRAELGPDGLLNLEGVGIESFEVPQVPINIRVGLALRIAGTEQDFEAPHDVRLQLYDADMNMRADTVIASIDRPGFNPRKPPGWEAAIEARADFEFGAGTEGLHSAHILLDGNPEKQLPLMVTVKQP